jgi:hypothetical protein
MIRNQDKSEKLNFLIYAPGIVKRDLKDGLHDVISEYRDKTGNILTTYGPMEWPSHDNDEYEDISKAEDIDHFPDVVAAMGFGDFFRRGFIDRFVKSGYFKNAWEGPVNPILTRQDFMITMAGSQLTLSYLLSCW